MNSTFQLPNGEWLHGVAAYENGHWDHVYRKNGNPFTASVTDMFVDTINNDLYLGSVYLYRYDGEVFHNIAQLGGMVYEHAMCMYRGDLYIGGNFTSVNGIPVNYMAKWDGTEWSGENLGASNVLTALYEYKNELYVGGAFDTVAGFLPAHGIARYHESSPSDCHWLRPRVQTAVHEDTFSLLHEQHLHSLKIHLNIFYLIQMAGNYKIECALHDLHCSVRFCLHSISWYYGFGFIYI
jgi:hypothetical protein